MEIPGELKNLYKHWQYHTNLDIRHTGTITIDKNLLRKMGDFAAVRMRIWEKKNAHDHPPLTQDSILRKYRFCNIYRELDRQTIEIHSRLMDAEDNFALWLLNIAFQRFVCRPDTLLKVGRLDFSKRNNNKVFNIITGLERPIYGNAYVFPISIIQQSDYPSREKFFCFYLPSVMERIAGIIREFDDDSVNTALEKILPAFGFNFRFHWTEILIDVAYQFPEKINLYRDFPIGPGALPIMKKLNSKASPSDVCNNCVPYRINNFPHLKYNGSKVVLSAENWEGIACEFRKYTNLKSGSGRVRIYGN